MLFKCISPIAKFNKINQSKILIKSKYKFYKWMKFSHANDHISKLRIIKNLVKNSDTERAFYEIQKFLPNGDLANINKEEFLQIIFELNLEFLKKNETEFYEIMSESIMNSFEKVECDVKSLEIQVSLSEMYFMDLFQIDSQENFKRCLRNINSRIQIENFEENKENRDLLFLLGLRCRINLLKIKFFKKAEKRQHQLIIKDLDKIVCELEEKFYSKNKNKFSETITKSHFYLADFYLILNEFEKSLKHHNILLNLKNEGLPIDDIITNISLFKNLSTCHYKLNHTDMTIFYLNKNIVELEKLLQEADNLKEQEIIRKLGMPKIVMSTEDYIKNKFSHKFTISYELATSYDILSQIYLKESSYDISKDLCIKALDFYKQSTLEEIYTINITHTLCFILYFQEEFERCIFFGEKFLELSNLILEAKKINTSHLNKMTFKTFNLDSIDARLIDVTYFVGNSYYNLENLEKSKFYAAQLLKLTKDKFLPLEFETLTLLNDFANFNLVVGNYFEAVEFSELLLKKFINEKSLENNSDFHDELVEVYITKAEGLLQLQNFQPSKETFYELLNFIRKYNVNVTDEQLKNINDRIDQIEFGFNNNGTYE